MPRLQLSQRTRVVFTSETSTEAAAMIAIRGLLHPGTSRRKWPNWSAQVSWLQQRVVQKSYVWSAYSSKFSKMVHCLAINCTNSHRKGKPLPKGIRIHNIPKDPGLRKRWNTAIKRKDPPITNKSGVCSEHFVESDYERDLKAELMGTPNRMRLISDAVPSVINFFF